MCDQRTDANGSVIWYRRFQINAESFQCSDTIQFEVTCSLFLSLKRVKHKSMRHTLFISYINLKQESLPRHLPAQTSTKPL